MKNNFKIKKVYGCYLHPETNWLRIIAHKLLAYAFGYTIYCGFVPGNNDIVGKCSTNKQSVQDYCWVLYDLGFEPVMVEQYQWSFH